jgi:hypothetical protein
MFRFLSFTMFSVIFIPQHFAYAKSEQLFPTFDFANATWECAQDEQADDERILRCKSDATHEELDIVSKKGSFLVEDVVRFHREATRANVIFQANDHILVADIPSKGEDLSQLVITRPFTEFGFCVHYILNSAQSGRGPSKWQDILLTAIFHPSSRLLNLECADSRTKTSILIPSLN